MQPSGVVEVPDLAGVAALGASQALGARPADVAALEVPDLAGVRGLSDLMP